MVRGHSRCAALNELSSGDPRELRNLVAVVRGAWGAQSLRAADGLEFSSGGPRVLRNSVAVVRGRCRCAAQKELGIGGPPALRNSVVVVPGC